MGYFLQQSSQPALYRLADTSVKVAVFMGKMMKCRHLMASQISFEVGFSEIVDSCHSKYNIYEVCRV